MWFFCPCFCLCVVLCIYWFANVAPSLHPCNEIYLIMVYDLFSVLLNSLSKYFSCWLSSLCSSKILTYNFLFFFFFLMCLYLALILE
jgi:hypothetical protein